MKRIVIDLICITLLVCIPESILRRTGLYRSIWMIAKSRREERERHES